MVQNQKATGIITLSAVSIKICCPLFCPLFKNTCSPFAIALRTGIIYRTQTQTNKFLTFVCFLSLKCQTCLTFVMKITKKQISDKHCKLVTLTSLYSVLYFNFLNEHPAACVCSSSYIVWSLRAEGKSSISSHV